MTRILSSIAIVGLSLFCLTGSADVAAAQEDTTAAGMEAGDAGMGADTGAMTDQGGAGAGADMTGGGDMGGGAMPTTASALPIVGLVGASLVALGFAVRFIGRRS